MMKNITLMANNSFHYLNVSNTWNITRSYKKLLGICYNCDKEYHISPKLPLPCNEENINQER